MCHDLGIGKDFFNWTQKVLPLKEKIDTPYLIKIEKFCLLKKQTQGSKTASHRV